MTEAITTPPSFRMTLFDMVLYSGIIFAWSTSWYPLTLQVGVVAPEVSLTWRFLMAALVMFIFLVATGRPVRFPLKDHLRFAGLGVLIFSTNFLLFYYASKGLASGLLSVMFSTASIVSLILSIAIFRQRPHFTIVLGAMIGVAGISLIFWPELTDISLNEAALNSVILCLGGTLCFSLGSLLSADNQKRRLPLVSSSAWGMAYGALWMAVLSLVRGQVFTVDWSVGYLGSLAWLTVSSTILAFAAYLTLVGRIGAARAGYATVIFPIFALLISTVIEGYQWTGLSIAGLTLALIGNYFVLARR